MHLFAQRTNKYPKLLSIAVMTFTCSLSISAETLKDVYELALQNDAQLKAAEASYKSGRENYKLTRSALLPQVSASYTYSSTDLEGTGLGQAGLRGETLTDVDSKKLSIDLQQNLFNLPAWFTFKRGKRLSEQAEAQFSYDQQDLIVRVAEAYFNVLRAKENLDTATAEETALKRQLEQTEQRFEVGLIAITDVHEARAAFDLAMVTRLDAQGQLGISYEALSVITGQSHSNIWLLSEKFPVNTPVPVTRADWVDFALKNNFQLKVAQLAESAAHQNAKSKKAEHLPKLTGGYSYSDSDTDGTQVYSNPLFPTAIDSEEDGSTISLNLSVPIFSGGGVSASRRQAYQDYIASRERSILTQRNTIQSTRSLHLTVTTDVGKVNARQQSITSAESALEATQAGYEVGTRNIVDVLDSQRFLFRAVRDYSNARYDYVINNLKLKQQAGTLSPQEIYDLTKWLKAPQAPTAKNSAM